MSRTARAAARAEQYLATLNTIESLVADVRSGRPRPDDCRHVSDALLADQREDGSWHGSLLYTSSMLGLLLELGATRVLGVDRAIEWIHARAGEYPDVSSPVVFVAAPADVDLSSLTLLGGYGIGGDPDVRFAISCLAAASLVEWGEAGRSVDMQVAAAEAIVRTAMAGTAAVSMAALLCGVRLMCAAASPAREHALSFIAQSQRGDGTWRGADLFLVLDTLGYACRLGCDSDLVLGAIKNAASTLFVMQQSDGSWGRQTGPAQMLSGLSALRALAARDDGAAAARSSGIPT
jgi:hypothetical protein